MIKRVEINYRGIFQKTLGRYIGNDVVKIASRMGKIAFSNSRYSDSPERNGIPCKYFAFVSPDLTEEELEAECGAKLDIDETDISVVLDDTMVKGVEPWGWHGIRPINEKVGEKGCHIVVTQRKHEDLLKFMAKKPFPYRMPTLSGEASFAGLWVFKDDLTRERCVGAIAAVDPGLIEIDAVEEYYLETTKDELRAEAARAGYDEAFSTIKVVNTDQGIEWPYEIPVLPKWHEFQDTGVIVPAIKAGFKAGPRSHARNDMFKHGTAKSERPVVRFDICTKCTLCWLECPDGCFDPTDDGLFDVNYEVCTGCHKCADICPVKECIVMVSELDFDIYDSPWEHFTKNPEDYTQWVEDKKGDKRIHFEHITGKGKEYREGKSVAPQLDK